ncbi:MAG: 16S rRNA (guanine(966)-N(2))-methyltransferase RsmD [Gammaproteobacteria bacterium]
MRSRHSKPSRGRERGSAGQFRIIAGRWRGRRLEFPALEGVRPTADRVRETVFNWLQPVIQGSDCLDLFAGSGALGLEALSRGAAAVTFVDRSPVLVRAIAAHLGQLDCGAGAALCSEARSFLQRASGHYDLVFLDPPFGSGLLPELCQMIDDQACLKPGGRVYLEHEASTGPPDLPAGWRMLRSARAGNVSYHLASCPEEVTGDSANSAI